MFFPLFLSEPGFFRQFLPDCLQAGKAVDCRHFLPIQKPFFASQRSASRAAAQPEAAEVIAWA